MQEENLIIGFDLCDDYSQVSYQMASMEEPKTLSVLYGGEKYQIPTVLLKCNNMDKWYFGDEALKVSEKSEGLLVKNILKKCSEGKSVYFEGEEYDGSALLEIFIKRSLKFLSYEGIEARTPDVIMFTLEKVNKRLANAIKKAAIGIGVNEKNIYITTHEESFVDYTMAQDEELRTNDVLLLEYGKSNMKWYILNINRKTKPVTMKINQGEFENVLPYEEMYVDKEKEAKNTVLDELVSLKLEALLNGKMISCVFLIGDGFEQEWAKKTFRYLCNRARVFQGKNLFSKGACYGATKRFSDKGKIEYLYLGPQKLMVNVGIDLMTEGNNGYYSLISAGENWYEAVADCEVIMEDTDTIEIKLIPIDNKDVRTIIVHLNDMPKRPAKTNRMRIQIEFLEENLGLIKVSDVGFGEFFKATDKQWEHEIVL